MVEVADEVSVSARRKIAVRLLPFLFGLYILSYIDRVNIGFAGLNMTGELHFSNEVFGFASGILFFGLCLLEIPGGVVAERWSARKWLATIMIVWGFLAAMTGLIHTALQLNVIRFFLGVAEGGFFPAVIVYLTHWFRQGDRAKAVAFFMMGIPVSNTIGGLIAAQLLALHWLGLSGWRWLLILEGLPAVVGGVVTLFYLTDWPRDAKWLAPEERGWISDAIAQENRENEALRPQRGMLRSLATPAVVGLFLAYFFQNTAAYGLTIWGPKLVQHLPGLTIPQVALVASIPNLCAIPAMILMGWYVDRTGRHRLGGVIAGFAAAAGFAVSQLPAAGPVVVMAGFSVAMMGVMSFFPCFWALPSRLLSPSIVPAACGVITTANIGGFVGPYAMVFLTDLTGSQVGGVLAIMVSAAMAGVCVGILPRGLAHSSQRRR